MTPLGHLSVSYLMSRPVRRLSLAALLLGGILPDLDIMVFAFPFYNAIHRIWTHNLLLVGLAAGAAALAGRTARQRLALGGGLLLGALAHLLVDSVMDGNPSNGIGVALFYPFSNWMFSPFNLQSPSLPGNGLAYLGPLVQHHAWAILLWEAPLALLALLAWQRAQIKG